MKLVRLYRFISVSLTKTSHLIVQNTFQPRVRKEVSTHIGLQNLTERYKLASDKSPVFKVENGSYVAKIPLL